MLQVRPASLSLSLPQKIYPGPIPDVILKCGFLRSHDVFFSEELGCFGMGSYPSVIPYPIIMPYPRLSPYLFVTPCLSCLKSICAPLSVRDLLFLIYRLPLIY